MRLLKILEPQAETVELNLVEKHKLKVGMTSYDVDWDVIDGRVNMGVLQNGMTIGEMIYEDGEIVWIHVEPFFRRQGVGTAMVDFLREKNYTAPIPEAKTADGTAFFNTLAEALDSTPIDYEMTKDTPKEKEYHFMAHVQYFAHFGYTDFMGDRKWTLNYGLEDVPTTKAYTPTGKGNAGSILSTVIAITQDFISRTPEAEVLEFDGSKNNKLSKLYDRMVPYLANKLGFEYRRHDQNNYVIYRVDLKNSDLSEGANTKCIVVDVQPSYTGVYDGDELPWIGEMMQFLNKQGNILLFANAEQDGLTSDTMHDIQDYWEDSGFDPNGWNRTELVDKGYGYFRAWMDEGVQPDVMIKVIREMYNQGVNDTRMLFDEDAEQFAAFVGPPWQDWMEDEPMTVEWTSLAQLKRYSGALIMGGGRDECLREVELLMNAFNIKYKRVEDFVYG